MPPKGITTIPQTIKVDPIDYVIEEPTRQCLVCKRKEYPSAPMVDTSKAWLCLTCKGVLQSIIEERVTGGRDV